MGVRTIIGDEPEKEKIEIKEYENGTTIVETGDPASQTFLKGKKPVRHERGTTTKKKLESLLREPRAWTFDNDELKRNPKLVKLKGKV